MTAAPYRLYYFSAGNWTLFNTYPDSEAAKAAGKDLAHPWRHQPATWLKPTGEPLETISAATDKPVFPGGRHETRCPRNGR
jgi:hypothetical protein